MKKTKRQNLVFFLMTSIAVSIYLQTCESSYVEENCIPKSNCCGLIAQVFILFVDPLNVCLDSSSLQAENYLDRKLLQDSR